METYEVTIEGTNFLLLHKYLVASVKNPKPRKGLRDSTNFLDEWEKTTYINENGYVVMPSANIMACIFDGAKGIKIGKKSLSRIIYTSMVVKPFEPEILISNGTELKPITLEDIKNKDWLHMVGAVIGRSRVDRVRTCLPIGWRISFQLVVKDNTLTKEDIKDILDNAGENAGIGDWRPSAPKKPGAYGTFKVIDFN
jgi:hypothetical protein